MFAVPEDIRGCTKFLALVEGGNVTLTSCEKYRKPAQCCGGRFVQVFIEYLMQASRCENKQPLSLKAGSTEKISNSISWGRMESLSRFLARAASEAATDPEIRPTCSWIVSVVSNAETRIILGSVLNLARVIKVMKGRKLVGCSASASKMILMKLSQAEHQGTVLIPAHPVPLQSLTCEN